MEIQDFWMKHKGETCLLVFVGPNLNLTPPEWFDYPSFSCNSIFKYEGWKPTYYVGVDRRLREENSEIIMERFADIPKFFPTPDWDELQGPNIYRFKHRMGELWIGGQSANQKDALTRGIGYARVPDAIFQIAWHMGFTTMLVIGVQHKPPSKEEPENERQHFWGLDTGAIANQPVEHWFNGYRHWAHAMKVRVLNISEDTYVPKEVIPRDNWRNWKNT